MGISIGEDRDAFDDHGPARTRLEHFAARLDLEDQGRFLGDVWRRRPGRLLPGLRMPSGSPRTHAARRTGWCRWRRWRTAAR